MKIIIKKVISVLLAISAVLTQSSMVMAMEETVMSVQTSVQEETVGFSDEGRQGENSWRYEDGNIIDMEEEDGEIRIQSSDLNLTLRGIDVSEHNSVGKPGTPQYQPIDWEKVKASGIDFVILRCGYGSNYTMQDDEDWEYNVSECERLGIPYGVYLYSYAESNKDALSEAHHVLRLIKDRNLSYPVYFDMEESRMLDDDLAEIATTFCNEIINAGYPVGVYANLNWWNNYLTDPCFLNWHRWVAQYNTTCDYKGIYGMWQNTSKGKVDGIEGNVDMNYLIGYPADHGEKGNYSYSDVRMGDWFRRAALYAASEGIMTGLSEGIFGPDDKLYRAQFATILYRMSGSPEVEYQAKFPDVPDGQFYSDAVIWASSDSVGVITGYTSTGCFGPGDLITREQMVVMIYRYANYLKKPTTVRADLSGFSDADDVNDYALEAMQWAVARGLIQGDNGRINPQGNANRAECATIIMRFIDGINRPEVKENETGA